MKRKHILSILLLVMTLFLVACGNKGEGNSSNSNNSKPIVIGIASDWKTLDPARAYEVYGNFYFYATYQNLYMMEGDEMVPQPALAKDHSIDESGLVYTFNLNEGQKFSSGNELTSEDVVFSLNRTINIKDNASAMASGVEKVEAKDKYIVEITLKEKDSSFLAKLTNNAFAVLDSKVLKENGGSDKEDASVEDTASTFLDSNSAGSGPYVLSKWTQNTEMILEKNPNYTGEVNAERIIIKEMPDPNTQIQALEKGEIDVALTVGPDQVKALKSDGNGKVVSAPTSTISFLLMNHDDSIGKEISNPLVQQAVRYAIDYKGFQTLAGEGALLPLSFVQDGFIGAKSKSSDFQDLEKAKSLMKEAGLENGFTIPLTVANFDSEGLSWTTMGEKIKEDLAKININVEIKTGEIGVVIEDYRTGKSPFLLMHWSPDYYDLNNQLAFLPGDIVGTRANWLEKDNSGLAEISKIVKGEVDQQKREELSIKMQEELLNNSPYAFLIQHPKSFAVSNNLEGVTYNDMFKLQLNKLKLTE